MNYKSKAIPMDNILMHTFNTPFESVPFNEIKDEQYEIAIKALIEQTKSEIQAIATDSSAPTFENTILALELTGKQLNRVTEAFFNITSAETNDTLENIQENISPLLAAFSNDINLNEDLWKRVKAVYDNVDLHTNLDAEDKKLLEQTYKGFLKNGALLDESKKETLRSIDGQLASLKVKFAQNVLQETNKFFLHLTTAEDVAGIPDGILAMAAEDAKSRELTGWVFTLQYPSYVPFMTYAANRTHRATMHTAYGQRAYKANEFNNQDIIKDIVRLKQERATLLGFHSHADSVLRDRMAGNATTVINFLEDLLEKALPFGQQDVVALAPLAAADGITEMMPYDHSYYAEKLRAQKFAYDEEAMKPYFSLDKVRQAAFDLATTLYDITFEERKDIAVYHPEVTVYEVKENGAHKALLYTDWHPRVGKRAGAWMTSFKGQYIDAAGINHRPHISIVCNFSRPTVDTPSLLTFNEVTTLFHEFGHALHGILANTKYESLSGTNVYWDFVELPSQFMENFCYEKEFLQTFAQHYSTGEVLPDTELDKIVASANYMEGYQTVRQLSFGLLDMAFHNGATKINSLEDFESSVLARTRLYPTIQNLAMSASFSHIFGGGYSAGYYSYKWAEVLDADAFAYFKENGIFNKSVATKFKTLLSSGGTIDPMELYVQFRGRKPDNTALLERAGLQ